MWMPPCYLGTWLFEEEKLLRAPFLLFFFHVHGAPEEGKEMRKMGPFICYVIYDLITSSIMLQLKHTFFTHFSCLSSQEWLRPLDCATRTCLLLLQLRLAKWYVTSDYLLGAKDSIFLLVFTLFLTSVLYILRRTFDNNFTMSFG